MRDADKIRMYGRDKYVLPARKHKQRRFTIRAGDVVHDLGIRGRAPAVCSALKSREFLKRNNLHLVEQSGPKSGQSTTVTYTYEFLEEREPCSESRNPWTLLRGTLKDVFAELGGGEAYLQKERDQFFLPKESR
jgi:hypothetical protein